MAGQKIALKNITSCVGNYVQNQPLHVRGLRFIEGQVFWATKHFMRQNWKQLEILEKEDKLAVDDYYAIQPTTYDWSKYGGMDKAKEVVEGSVSEQGGESPVGETETGTEGEGPTLEGAGLKDEAGELEASLSDSVSRQGGGETHTSAQTVPAETKEEVEEIVEKGLKSLGVSEESLKNIEVKSDEEKSDREIFPTKEDLTEESIKKTQEVEATFETNPSEKQITAQEAKLSTAGPDPKPVKKLKKKKSTKKKKTKKVE